MRGVVFGLQRSGTNFTEALLREHFQINIVNTDRNYIWKHGHDFDLSKIDSDCFHIYIIKYPYSWIESIRRKQVDILKRHPEVKSTKNTQIQLCKDIDLYQLAKLYNDHTCWWHREEVKSRINYIGVQYEQLIRGDNAIKNFLKEFKSSHDVHSKVDINSSFTHPKKVSQSDVWTEDTRDMYLKKILPTLTWKEVDLINGALTPELFEYTGYKKISSETELMQNHK